MLLLCPSPVWWIIRPSRKKNVGSRKAADTGNPCIAPLASTALAGNLQGAAARRPIETGGAQRLGPGAPGFETAVWQLELHVKLHKRSNRSCLTTPSVRSTCWHKQFFLTLLPFLPRSVSLHRAAREIVFYLL
jgi:hypothetical protein